MDKFWTGLIAFLAEWVLIPLEGFVVSAIWGWFIVSLFGLPSLGLAGGIGLILLFRMLRGTEPNDIADEPMKTEDVIDHLLARVANSVVILLIGYLAHMI